MGLRVGIWALRMGFGPQAESGTPLYDQHGVYGRNSEEKKTLTFCFSDRPMDQRHDGLTDVERLTLPLSFKPIEILDHLKVLRKYFHLALIWYRYLLVADTRLCTLSCRSVGPSVGSLVRLTLAKIKTEHMLLLLINPL